jgi:hypothetical protein
MQAIWPGMELVLFYRDYAKDFNNLHAYAFGEQNGRSQNEKGLYTGLKLKMRRGTRLQAYYDIFRCPWRTPDVPQPSSGDDFMIQADQNIWNRTNLNILFKNQRKDESVKTNDALGRDVVAVEKGLTRRLRFQVDYVMVPEIRLRFRIERAWYRVSGYPQTNENGNLYYEEIKLTPAKKLSINVRLSFFDTQGSNSSMYEFEDDLDGLFTNARFSGKGKRWYCMMKYQCNRHIRLAIKYWELCKPDVGQIGLGGDAVNGTVLRKIALALDVNF